MDKNDPASQGTNSAPEESQASPPPRRLSARRRWLIILGFVALFFGSLVPWLMRGDRSERRGWDAYNGKQYDMAISLFNDALKVNPASADAYTGRSWAHLAKEEWQQALADSTEALRLAPESAMAWTAKGNTLAAMDRIAEAMAALDEAIRHDPHCVSAYYHRARIAYYHGLMNVQPLADLREAVRLNPDFAPAYSLQGLIYYERKDYDKGIAQCDRALQADSREASAYLYRGFALLAKGRLKAGKADIQQALDLDPGLQTTLDAHQEKTHRQ